MSLDAVTIVLLETALFVLLVVALVKERSLRTRPSSGFEARVTRGPQSMDALYLIYGGATTLICILAVQIADAFEGKKVAIILFNYGVLTYLVALHERQVAGPATMAR